MATLTVGDLTPRQQYTASSGQTVFSYNFPIFKDSDLKVYVGSTLKTLDTEYEVTGAGTTPGGNVTLTSGATAGDIVTINRDLPVARTTDYATGGALLAENLNDDLDKLVMMVQQVEAMHESRTVVLAPMAEGSLTHIDGTIADRADKYLAFTASGDVSYTAGTSSDIVPGQTGVDLVAASTEQDGRDAIDVYSQSEVDDSISTSPTITSPTINTSVSGSAILDDDAMTSASDTTLATSESIKAYVDFYVAHLSGLIVAPIMPRVSPRVCIWDGSESGTAVNGLFLPDVSARELVTLTNTHITDDFGITSGSYTNLRMEWQCIVAEYGFAIGDVVSKEFFDSHSDTGTWTTWASSEGDLSTCSIEFVTGDGTTDAFHMFTRADGNSGDVWANRSNWQLYARIYYTL